MKANITYDALWFYNEQAHKLANSGSLQAAFHYQDLQRFFSNNGPSIKEMNQRLNALQRHCCEGTGQGDDFIIKTEMREMKDDKDEVMKNETGEALKEEVFVYKSPELEAEYKKSVEEWKKTPVRVFF